MTHNDAQARVLAEWFRLPESRRIHATDAVAFAFRLLREQPEIMNALKGADHEAIIGWLLPLLTPPAAPD